MKKELIYVAHRGSKIRNHVENTLEAFIDGIEEGYKVLECDVRVTKDLKFIVFHDENLKRLTENSKVKSELNVNEVNYDQIKDIELTENYKGVLKTGGYICLFEDLLKLCKEKKVKLIVELKWTNGIYSHNDNKDIYNFDNIPHLIALIEQNQMKNNCFIMTSMRGCLDYVKRNDPEIALQWLARSTVNEYLNWAIENNIHIDCEGQYLTKEIVDIAHQNNLIVNVWTIDDEENRQKFIKMGVDMITTNVLK